MHKIVKKKAHLIFARRELEMCTDSDRNEKNQAPFVVGTAPQYRMDRERYTTNNKPPKTKPIRNATHNDINMKDTEAAFKRISLHDC